MVESNGLLNRRAPKGFRGFESRSLRHFKKPAIQAGFFMAMFAGTRVSSHKLLECRPSGLETLRHFKKPAIQAGFFMATFAGTRV